MFLTALLIASASAEWVEISQQHYRKPLRTYQFTTKAIDLEDTTKPWHNYSVTEYNWNTDRTHSDEAPREDDKDYEPERFNYKPAKAAIEEDTFKGTVERVPNVGNVRKVQLTNSPVKSPNIKWNNDGDKNPFKMEQDDSALPETIDKQAYDYTIPINNANFAPTTPRMPTLTKYKEGVLFTDAPVEENEKQKYEFHNYTAINSPEHVFLSDNFMGNKKNKGREKYNYTINTEEGKETLYQTNENKPKGLERNRQDDKRPHSENADPTRRLKIEVNKTINKVDTIENLMKFMMVVTDTISKNSRRSFNGKLRYFQELKNNILANIEQRIDATWPDDAPSTGAWRRSRAARADAEPRGHVQFPSSESALMTISFLTFAVFLIKLVLQVIQTYKNKTMMVAPLVVAAAGRAAFTHRTTEN